MSRAVAEEEFEPFDLTVLFAGEPAEIWLSASSRIGAVQAVPRPDPAAFSLAELSADADWFRTAIAEGRPGALEGARIGRRLHDLVFGVEEIASLFRRTRGAAAGIRRPIVIRLLAAPQAVAALPWELLADPDGDGRPLAFAPDSHLVRLARDRRYPLRVEPIRLPLNVLLILANPQGSGADDAPFDHYEEGRALLAELSGLIDKGVLVVDVEDRPSIENLRRRIGSRPRGYHVVHYLGHAQPDKLKLESPNGQVCWETSEKFNALLQSCPDLRLTFFAGCRTASLPPGAGPAEVAAGHPTTAFATTLSIADRCVRDACQTVLGMQAVLPFRTEQVLTRFFYQALCAGATVARALALARAAVHDDDVVGGELLDWAVPSLVTGHLPGAIVDPSAAPASVPAPRKPRVQLKLDLAESDREFFARFAQLRDVLSVLGRRAPERVLWVTGGPGSGKSRLLARALDELDQSIVAVLYVSAVRLAQQDPVLELCSLVTELLERSDRRVPTRDPGWDGSEWWDRLIEALVDTSFVLVVDDVDRIDPAAGAPLGGAIDALVGRVSLARVALAADAVPDQFLSAGARSLAKVVRVPPLELHDVLQWVRRNRPALAAALATRSEAELAPIWNRLSTRLHLWSRLADELARQRVKDLDAAVDAAAALEPLAASPAPLPPVAPGGLEAASPDTSTDGLRADGDAGPGDRVAPEGSSTAPWGEDGAASGADWLPGAEEAGLIGAEGPRTDHSAAAREPGPVGSQSGIDTGAGHTSGPGPRSSGPLRVAIAGPFTVGRQHEFANAITALALAHGIGARVVMEGASDASTAMATLLAIDSPFGEDGGSSPLLIMRWLERVRDERADIVLLDYGGDGRTDEDEAAVRALLDAGALVLAAGGNSNKACYPAWYEGVLAVGALDDSGEPAPWSQFYDAAAGKPDLFALGTLAGTPLAPVAGMPRYEGTSAAALNVLGASVLVWAVDRSQTAGDVAGALQDSARTIGDGAEQPRPALDLPSALDRARLRLVRSGLARGPLDTQGVASATGLSEEAVEPLLKDLLGQGALQQRGDRYFDRNFVAKR